MESVIITGGAGFIGSHIADELIARKVKVRIIDAVPFSEAANIHHLEGQPGFEYIQADIVDPEAAGRAVGQGFDTIIHLASVVGIEKYISSPLDVIDVNIIGTRNVLNIALERNVRVLLSSTSEIYGNNPNVPWKEDGDRLLGPTTMERWTYSSSKAVAEHMANAMHRTNGLRLTIVRFFNVYGPRQNPIFVISSNIKRVVHDERPILYDSGDQTRCFTYVGDAVQAVQILLESEQAVGQTYNIGSNAEISMRGALEAVIRASGKDLEIEQVDTNDLYGDAYQDIYRRIPDVEKIYERVGWRAQTTLDEGLAATYAWAVNNY